MMAATAVVAASVHPAAAQKVLPRSIQFQGAPEYSDQELLDAAGLKKGVELETAEMNVYAKRLADSGVFNNVAYKFDGADLIFTLTPDPTLLPVRLDNLPFTPGPGLDAELHKRLPLYHGKVPSEGGLLNDVRQSFERMLAAEGVKASVAAAPYSGEGDRNQVTAMRFTITAPPVRVGTVRLQGASMVLLPRLQAMAALAGNSVYDTQDTPASLDQRFTSFYQDQGFAAVKVHAAPSGAPVQTADAILVPYTVSIQEGRPYRVGKVRLPSGSLVTQEEANKILASPNKTTAGEGLRNVLALIDTRYKSKGYLDLVVTPQPAFDDSTGTVDYVIDIAPGPVYHVAYVKFDNAGDELRGRLMRQWQLMPGDPFDQTYLDTFLTRAESGDPVLRRSLAGVLAHFETSADPVTHDVNVVIRLEKP